MDRYEELDRRSTQAESLERSAAVLYDLLAGGYAVWTDGSLYSIKQLVDRVKGLKIHIYAKEHGTPHFHVESPDIDACFSIENCTLIRGDIDGREKRLVCWWFERSRPLLVATWNATRPADCPVGPIRE